MRPYLRAANVGWSGLLLDDVKMMNFTDAEMDTYRLQPGDIVLSEASGSPGEVGKPALWTGELDDCAFQNTLIRVRPTMHEPRFLLHYFRYVALTGGFLPSSRGVGINHLGRARLAGWRTPMPGLVEQQRIVEILEDHLFRLEAAEHELSRAAAKTLAAKRSLRELAIAPAEDWRVFSAEELTSGHRGDIAIGPFGSNLTTKDYRTSGAPLVFVRNVRARDFHVGAQFVSPAKALELRAHQVVDGDVLMTKMGDPPGDTAVYRGEPGIITSDVLRLRPGSEHDPRFLSLALGGDRVRAQILSITSGVAQKKISLARFRSTIRVELPDREVQVRRFDAFAERTEELERAEDARRRAAVRGLALRRAVLAAAFSGKLTGHRTDVEVIEELTEAGA